MNLNEHQIEHVLRRAPAPQPPSTLEAKLMASIRDRHRPDSRNHRTVNIRTAGSGGWRRWWPLILPAVATVAFSPVVVMQKVQLREIVKEVRDLREQLATPASPPEPAPRAVIALPDERDEIARLRDLVAALGDDVARLEAVQADNERIRTEIASYRSQLSPEMQMAVEQRDRAQAIQCVNNLKQLGLAVRVWAVDNDDHFPPDILSQSNEIAAPKILVCPSDTSRQAASDWGSFNLGNTSYEFLSPGPGTHGAEPHRLMWRCPIHGHITLCDGSVQMAVAKKNPERLTWRNGSLYLTGDDAQTASGGPMEHVRRIQSVEFSPDGTRVDIAVEGRTIKVQASPELMERYGLLAPSDGASTSFSPGASAQGIGTLRTEDQRTFQMTPELMRRYGLIEVVPSTNVAPAESEAQP